MLMLIMRNMTNNTMYNVQELHAFSQSFNGIERHYKSFHFHQYFHYIFQLIYQLFSFYNCNFYNLNIALYHIIYHIDIHKY